MYGGRCCLSKYDVIGDFVMGKIDKGFYVGKKDKYIYFLIYLVLKLYKYVWVDI